MEQEYTQEEKQKIAESFIRDGILVRMPSQRKKQLIVLAEMAKLFESDRDYAEKEVNAILAPVYEDFVTLRRDLIEAKFLSRDHGIYRKVDTEPKNGL